MNILISMRVIENDAYPERRDALSQEWAAFLSQAVPEAVLIPVLNNSNSVATLLRETNAAAVILTGGNSWGEAAERDATERLLYEHAVNKRLPLLAICRGMQVVHVLNGGQLTDLSAGTDGLGHVATRHKITVTNENFRALVGSEELEVNSFHQFGFRGSASDIEALALAEDGTVEAFRHCRQAVLGLMWHPERESPFRKVDLRVCGQFLRTGGL